MISIVLYGRNDSYGYNLHKRGALSLNCMAEVLTAADDEILFVDYNTPDDLPTFPEAIEDTLTARAKRLLRILRVRPAAHDRFRQKTHLPTVEPLARNVAVRRSNENNPWVLSSNTDMIFVPRGSFSLSDIAGSAEAAWYGTPRFELPESLWESFDRLDPAGTIAAARRWGSIAHLNEVVYGAPAILYDAPGDFQLMRRSDLFAIDGFDERMVLGWHVDSNLAKRMSLVRGAPRPLISEVFGYHCDHTRHATPMHARRDLPINNFEVFVNRVIAPDLPQQRSDWGCAHDPIEEIGLQAGSRLAFQTMLVEVLPSASADRTTESYNTDGSYNSFWYDRHHVLPFVVDLLAALSRRTAIGWVGVRRDTFELFVKAFRSLGFAAPVMLMDDMMTGVAPDAPGIEIVGIDELSGRADTVIFEFGLVRDDFGPPRDNAIAVDLSADEFAALESVKQAFESLVAFERRRISAGKSPRRLIAVNSVRNDYEPPVMNALDAALTPFSTRLRHGYATPLTAEEQEAVLLRDVAHVTSGIRPADFIDMRAMGRKLADGMAFDGFGRARLASLADGLRAALDLPEGPTVLGLDTSEVQRVGERLTELTRGPSQLVAVGVVTADIPDASSRPLSKLASSADWDDARWSEWRERLGISGSVSARTPTAWWSTQALEGLDRLRVLSGAESAVVVARGRYPIFARLARYVARLTVVDVRLLTGEGPVTSASIARRIGRHKRVGKLVYAGRGNLRALAGQSRIALVLPGVAFADGIDGFVALLARLGDLLPAEAAVAICDEIVLCGTPDHFQPGTSDLPRLYEAVASAGFTPSGPIAAQILDRDVKRVLGPLLPESFQGSPPAGRGRGPGLRVPPDLPFLGREHRTGAVSWPFVMFLTRKAGG